MDPRMREDDGKCAVIHALFVITAQARIQPLFLTSEKSP
jgi:hypothetical protein